MYNTKHLNSNQPNTTMLTSPLRKIPKYRDAQRNTKGRSGQYKGVETTQVKSTTTLVNIRHKDRHTMPHTNNKANTLDINTVPPILPKGGVGE